MLDKEQELKEEIEKIKNTPAKLGYFKLLKKEINKMKQQEFNLSKYRHEKGKSTPFGFWYAEEDVKEFIRLLKEELGNGLWAYEGDRKIIEEIINKLAGKK